MKKIYLNLSILLILLFLSGCIGPDSSSIEHVITVKDFRVRAPSKIVAGSTVPITFWLKNQGNFIAKNIEVKFFDLQGFEVKNIECDGVKKSENLYFCKINEINPGRISRVDVELKTPESTGKKTVSYYVNSDYSGISKLLFNVWKKGEENPYGKEQSVTSGGPLKVSMDSSFLIRRASLDEESLDEWIEEGQEFTLYINIKKTSSRYNFIGDKIEKEKFKVKFNYIEPSGDDCDLTESGGYWIPKDDIDLNEIKPLICKMRVKDDIGDQQWVTGDVEVDYTYRYMFIEQEDIVIE